jgi:hypothetical protein
LIFANNLGFFFFSINCEVFFNHRKILCYWQEGQSSKWKLEFTGPNQYFEFILYIYLNKNWKIYRSEQSSSLLRVWFAQVSMYLFEWNISNMYTFILWNYWCWCMVCILCRKLNWKIYRSEQSFTFLGPEDQCSSWGLEIYQRNYFSI